MTLDTGVVWLTIFVLSVFVGIEVISKVSSTLHTPLMSGANAIHGIILLGAILVTGTTDNNLALVVGLVAIVLASVNMSVVRRSSWSRPGTTGFRRAGA